MVELEVVNHLVAGRLRGFDPRRQHLIPGRHGDVHLGGKAVRGVSADGKPARRIHQEGVFIVDGRELDAVDRRIFVPGEMAVVTEGDGDGLALGQRLVEAEPHAEILLRSRRRDLLAALVHHFGNVQRVVQLERRRVDILVQRREPDRDDARSAIGCEAALPH